MTASHARTSPPAPPGKPSPMAGLAAILHAMLGRVGVIALSVGTGILTARALKPQGRGELAAMILWPIFLSQALTLGLPSSLLYWIRRRDHADGRDLIGVAMLLGIGLCILSTFVGIMALPYWLTHYPAEIVRMSQWFMISTPATILLLIGRAALEARGRFGISSMLYLSSPIFTLACLTLLMAGHHLTSVSAAYAYVLSGVPPLLLIFGHLRSEMLPRWGSGLRSMRILLSYGFRSYGIDLCGSLSQYIDQALVLKLLTPADMGSYVVALSLSRIINTIFTSVAAVLFPKAISAELNSVYCLSVRACLASCLVALPTAAVMVFGSGTALRLLYGREYVVAQGLLKLLILEAILSGCVTVMSQIFMAIGRPGTVTLFQAAGLAMAVPLVSVLVPRFGSIGAGIALIMSAIVRACLLSLSYRKLPMNDSVPFHRQLWREARHLHQSFIVFPLEGMRWHRPPAKPSRSLR